MNEQTVPQKTEKDTSGNWAVAISVLLFVGLYLSGFIMGVVELSQRDATE